MRRLIQHHIIRKCAARVSLFIFLVAATPQPLASGQDGFGAATAPQECKPVAFRVTSVTFQGKVDGKDRILVAWEATRPPSPCVNFEGFRVEVKVKRKLGDVDSGTKTVSGSARSTVVEVPRSFLEAAPVSFEVRVSTSVRASLIKSVRVAGNGVPALAAATQTPLGTPGPCDPALRVSELNFLPGGATATKDVLGVFWEAAATSPCLTLASFRVTVKATRIDGGTQTATSNQPGSARSARIELTKGPDIRSFEVTLEARSVSSITSLVFSATRQGNF